MAVRRRRKKAQIERSEIVEMELDSAEMLSTEEEQEKEQESTEVIVPESAAVIETESTEIIVLEPEKGQIGVEEGVSDSEEESPEEEAPTPEEVPVSETIPEEAPTPEVVPASEAIPEEAISQQETKQTDDFARNLRVQRALALEKEIRHQREREQQRSKQILHEQEYINNVMDLSIKEIFQETREEQKYNREYEERIRNQVYSMYGISDDKIQGMKEYHNAWYQGASFALFFLSIILFGICGFLHGFDNQMTLFMAFYTAIGGTLLTHGKQRAKVIGFLVKGIYLLMFPAMILVFVCYELKFSEYEILLPLLTVAGAVILLMGVASYFVYDPYREDRKKRKKAERYLMELEKIAMKEVRSEEKAYEKQEKKRRRREEKEKRKVK